MGNDEMTNNAVALWVSKAGMNNFELAKEREITGEGFGFTYVYILSVRHAQ